MDPENQEGVVNQDNPTGEVEVQSPEQLAETKEQLQEAPAPSEQPSEEEDHEVTTLQEAINNESDPEKRAALEKQRNAFFAKRRREAKAAEEARIKAEQEREYYRGMAEAQRRQPQKPPEAEIPLELPEYLLPPMPKEEDFEDYNQYLISLGEYGAEKRLVEREWKQQQASKQAEIQQKVASTEQFVESGMSKYADFKQALLSIPLSDATLDAIVESENSVELAYFLGTNQKEAKRLYNLPERAMLRELGKIEARLTAPPPQQRTITNAPNPIKPPVPGSVSVQKSIEEMSPAEYNLYMNRKEFGPNWKPRE